MTMSAIAIGGSAVLGYMGQQDANNAMNNASSAQMAQQNAWNAQQDPFSAGGHRQQYVSQLNDLMAGGYQGIQNDPRFKWQQQQGQENLMRTMGARGLGGSGAEMAASMNLGYQQAGDFFNESYNRLYDLSGGSRGGGAAAMGTSPETAFNASRMSGMDRASAFGMGANALQGMFGGGSGGTFDGAQVGQQWNVGNEGSGTYMGMS